MGEGGSRRGFGTYSREWFFPVQPSPLIFARISLAALFPSSRFGRRAAPLAGLNWSPSSSSLRRRRNRASDFTYISEMRIDIPSPGLHGAHYIPPLSSFHGPRYEISSKTRYNLFLFLFFFSHFSFSFALNIISFLKSLLYRISLPPFVRLHIT